MAAQFIGSMKPHGAQARIYRIMEVLEGFGAAAKPILPSLYKSRDYYREHLGMGKTFEFPKWAVDEFMKGLNEGIESIEQATETPDDLISIPE